MSCDHFNLEKNCKDCSKIKRLWEIKLEKSGLGNIEQQDGNLKIWSSYFFKTRYDETKFKAKEDYYRMASQFLNDYHFQNDVDRFIWSQHADGISAKDIVKMLKIKGVSSYKNGVHRVIKRLTRLMFLGVGSDGT